MLASFRDTEVDKDHPLTEAIDKLKQGHLPLYQVLVKPFEIHDTSRIVSEILLEEEQEVLPLAKELQGRTEGNPFFVLELLRSLVDEKVVYFEDNHFRYDLAKLAQAALPTDIVEVVIKRISEVSEQGQTVLSCASVMGRDISFEMLSELTKVPQEQILDALEEGIQNQFLVRDVTGEKAIHFAHERILEAFYQKVPEDERKALHQYIGLSLETRHKDNLEPVLYELAHHFSSAGLDEKTLVYSTRGGKKAQNAYAHDQAIKLYGDAREILERQGNTNTEYYIDVLENMGAVYKTAGRFDEALEVLKICEQLIPKQDKIRRSEVLSKAGDTLWEKGEGDRATELLGQALKSLGVRLPRTMFGVVTGLLKESLIQGLHTILPFLFVRKEYKQNAKKAVIVRLLLRVAYFYYFTNLIRTLHLGMKYLNMGERMGPSRLLSNLYSTHTVIWAGVPFAAGRAQRDAKRSVKIAQDLNDRGAEGSAYGYYAVSTYSNRDIEEAYEYALKSIDILKGIGEYWDLGMSLYYRPSCGLQLGKNFETLLQEVEEMIQIARGSNSLQSLGWGLFQKVRLLALIGDERLTTEGIKSGEEGVRTMELVKDKVNCLSARSYLAFAHLRAGNYDEAVRITEEVARRYLLDNNAAAFIHDVFPVSAQVYLDSVRYKAGLAEDEKKKYLKKAKRFSKLAFRLKRFFPYLASHSYQVNGTYQWLSGKKKKAVEIWEEGIAYVRKQTKDRYRLASLLLEQASFLLKDDPDDKKAQEYLIEAKEILTEIGAKLDLQRVDELLGTEAAGAEAVESRQVLTMSRQLESLLNVTRAIGSVFDLEELLDKIIDLAMKVTGAERGFLLLYDEKDNTLRQKVSRGMEEALAGQSFSYETHKVSLEMVQQVEKTGEGVVEGQDGTGFPKIAADLREYDVKEALCVPLKAKDKPLGMIYLDNRMAGGIFGQDELELMSSFAVQASVSIENATLHQKAVAQERMEQDLEVAGEIQRLFLPKTVQVIEGVSIDARYSPAEFIGGDYYDVIKIDDNRYGIIIVDTSGHGSSAAIVMSVISFIVHSSAQRVRDTAELITELNNNLYERLEGEKYATAIFMVYDSDKGAFEYTNAGHSAILLYKKNKDELVELSEGGMPVGLMEDSKYEKGEFKFDLEDLILLQTDGVFETRNDKGEMFSLERVTQLLLNLKDQEVAEINKNIISEVEKFQGGGPQQDDITLIALRKTN